MSTFHLSLMSVSVVSTGQAGSSCFAVDSVSSMRKNLLVNAIYANSIFWVTLHHNIVLIFTDCHYGFIIESPKGKSNPNIEKENKIFMEVFIMSKVVEFLQANPIQYLATVGRDGKGKMPSVHVLGRDGRQAVVLHQQHKRCLQRYAEQSEIEISVSSPEYAWIRLHGKAVFENNMAAKEMCIQKPDRQEPVRRGDQPDL